MEYEECLDYSEYEELELKLNLCLGEKWLKVSSGGSTMMHLYMA